MQDARYGELRKLIDKARAEHPNITFGNFDRYFEGSYNYQKAKMAIENAIAGTIEMQPLLDTLQRYGLNIISLDELNDERHPDHQASLPVLIEELSNEYSPKTRRWMAILAGEKGAKKFLPKIEEVYRQESDDMVRDAIASSLSFHLTAKDIDFIKEVLGEEKYGKSRGLIMARLGELRTPEKYSIAEQYVDDPLLGVYAKRILDKRK